ncbi:threonine ammonia-lyase [Prevotella pectinovora]|jgi:threonine ammonia-lyase|uniref:Threonine dehydratase n=2 Tax=Prevotella pectinovora TaxID=1602169 RepID=A0A0D0IUU7_9BACT|nr:threonine ammonia-lyase [Prevotella pectinovora]KIP55199.1 threonine dehydratase [Prevotella pectinovora]KIP57276.1 threonine dehydratase [Prevotella pectinovora]KIP59128.1 threonine dehydratase [Prevotella pectinovora]KIP61569.1 threonine dehydratase [Prevotella pectinovora]
MLKLDNFYKARYELSKVIRQTEVVQAPQVNPECDVYLKLECLQRTGSFKVRGACYKISQLSDEEKAHGVIACSAGNHAQGVALGATAHGIKSLICLPAGAPISKVEATKGYGADVCLVPGVYDDAYQKAIELRDEKGYTFVHPFDDPNVIAGQGTIGLELIDQVKDMDAVVVPVGGGGLISGVAFALKTLNPHIKVYGVQAAGAASMVQSLHVHKRECLSSVSTIADGICVKEPGELTYEICSKYVDDIVTVSEDEICAAILQLLEKEKVVAEGAGATSVAAVMFNKVPVKGKKVVCIVSGGNIDVTILNRVVERGLAKSGRIAIINVELDDKPGKLVEVASVIAKAGANITNVYHDRNSDSEKVNSCILRVICETRNQEHVAAINNALRESGFKLV